MDWVIARLFRRYFGIRSVGRPNQDRELWELAGQAASRGDVRRFWYGVLDLADAFCRPKPRCAACPLVGDCTFGIASLAGEA